MGRLRLFVLLGVVSSSLDCISGSVSEVTVRPGDNVTLYCEYKPPAGVYTVWYRNCSHENQPPLVLQLKLGSSERQFDEKFSLKIYPRFELVKNHSSHSYDLLIVNVTGSDEGLYYCGTREKIVEDNGFITPRVVYSYSNITTKVKLVSNYSDFNEPPPDVCACRILLFCLCPASAVISSVLSSLAVYCLCNKKAKDPGLQLDQHRLDTRDQPRQTRGEDVCYAALEIRQASQRPKKKKAQSSDFSTYAAINTSRM